MKNKVSQSLFDTVDQNPHIDQVHFTADGHHHFRAFEHGKNLYTRLESVPEKSKSGIHTGKSVLVPIKNHKGEDHPDHLITETVTREQILDATPVPDAQESAIKKADIITALDGLSIEELKAILDKKMGASKKK